MKITEAHIQAIMMRWVMSEKHHDCCLPNSNQFYSWEADLLSVTRSGMVHEFEIKLNMADYKRDAKKQKHYWIGHPSHRGPSYFWYVTYEFDIEPPEKAGWIKISKRDSIGPYPGFTTPKVMKEAPELNRLKVDTAHQVQILRILSWHLANQYGRLYLNNKAEEGEIS